LEFRSLEEDEEGDCAFSAIAASLLKACSGTKRIMKGTRRPEKIDTKPNVQRQDLVLVVGVEGCTFDL
jgi:hypothetical protein